LCRQDQEGDAVGARHREPRQGIGRRRTQRQGDCGREQSDDRGIDDAAAECSGSRQHLDEIVPCEARGRQVGRLRDQCLLLEQARKDQPEHGRRRPQHEDGKADADDGADDRAALLSPREAHRATARRGQSSQT
jgi:hypothetical protein